MSLSDKVKSTKIVSKTSNKCLWTGPSGDGPNGGISQSMLNKFLFCRERFRIYSIEGLKVADKFSHRLHYGNMFHICEESGELSCRTKLLEYAQSLCKKYMFQQDEVNHWYEVCKAQFQEYVQYWKKHPQKVKRTSLLKEQVFDIEYPLPSGRKLRLRGKWDGVSLVEEDSSYLELDEHKTKGEIKEQQIANQLRLDLQTCFYIVALTEWIKNQRKDKLPWVKEPIRGVFYNVVRRPLSGGAGTIRQHKPTKSNPLGESKEDFYNRLAGVIQENPQDFFMRWNVTITKDDIENFKRKFLNPVLEQICDWYEWIKHNNDIDVFRGNLHYLTPFGSGYGGTIEQNTEYDDYILHGSVSGLTKVDTLFPELQ